MSVRSQVRAACVALCLGLFGASCVGAGSEKPESQPSRTFQYKGYLPQWSGVVVTSELCSVFCPVISSLDGSSTDPQLRNISDTSAGALGGPVLEERLHLILHGGSITLSFSAGKSLIIQQSTVQRD